MGILNKITLIFSLGLMACATQASKLTSPEVTEELNRGRSDAEIKKTAPNKRPKTAKEKAVAHVERAIKKYHEKDAIMMKVDKMVRVAMLDRITQSQGKMFFSKGRLRLDLEKPERSTIILNKENLWMINHTPEELGGGLQVAKMSAKKATKKEKSPLAFLLQDTEVFNDFALEEVVRDDRVNTYTLKPISKKGWNDLTKLILKIDSDDQIVEVAYWDSLENETKFKFKDFKYGRIKKRGAFSYAPPDDVDVVEY